MLVTAATGGTTATGLALFHCAAAAGLGTPWRLLVLFLRLLIFLLRLLIGHGATCTRRCSASAASGRLLSLCVSNRNSEASTCQETGETKTCQELFKFHDVPPFHFGS